MTNAPPPGFDAREKSEELATLIAGLGPDVRIAILTQDNPDPDAIGSALGLQRLCNHLRPELPSQIVHGGCISHPQNVTMVQLLMITLHEIDTLEALQKKAEEDGFRVFVMLVDAASTGGKNIQSTSVPPDAVFDHHKDQPPEGTPFVDIREVGATCSIIAEHLFHLEVPIGPKLATALYFGLHNDTKSFASHMTAVDFGAMQFLNELKDTELFTEIHEYKLPNYIFELEQAGQENKRHKGSLLVAGLGVLPASKRDGIAHVADRMVRLDDVTTVVIHAIIEDRIQASVRSKDNNLDTNEYVQQLFGSRYAGAKQGSGGAQVPIGFLAPGEDQDEGTRNLLTRYVNEFVARRAFSLFPDTNGR